MKILLIIVVIYMLNIYFSFQQMKKYNIKHAHLKKNYPSSYIATGKNQKILKQGSVSLLVINKAGIVEYGELMKGRTVFAKFQEIEGIKGLFVTEVKERFSKEEAILNAISFYEKVK